MIRRIFALATELIYILRLLHIRGMCAGGVNHVSQSAVVVQQGAGTQMVFVKGLACPVRHKEGGLICLQQCLFPNIGVRIVNECAGLNIAVCIDVEIIPPAGNTAFHIFAVIPEVQSENGLCLAEFTDLMVHIFPLLGCGH